MEKRKKVRIEARAYIARKPIQRSLFENDIVYKQVVYMKRKEILSMYESWKLKHLKYNLSAFVEKPVEYRKRKEYRR